MISTVLNTLQRGLDVMRTNSKMFLVGLLVFIFPLLFVWVTQNFYTTAYDNVHTAESRRVGMVHDALSSVVLAQPQNVDLFQSIISGLLTDEAAEVKTRDNADITKVRVYQETPNGFLVLAAENEELVGTYDPTAEILQEMGFTPKRNFLRFEFEKDGQRTWQAARQIIVADMSIYTFSEHDLSAIDSTMGYRRQQSYFGLTAIFVFLIGLAYWINRQTNWGHQHKILKTQLEERDLFSNMIAHEFRAPLTAVKGYASFLQESQSIKPEEKRYVDNIRTSAERLVALVNDFLEVARLQSGKMKLEPTEVDIREILIAVSQDIKPNATEKGLRLTYKPGTKPIVVSVDKNRLVQVLVNMVSNAIKYTKEGSVELSAVLERNKVVIRIMDTGMGISAEDQKKLFAPFERVGGVEKTETTGTGLGMYITKKLVEILGGTIGVESIKGVGSHIVVTLPAD